MGISNHIYISDLSSVGFGGFIGIYGGKVAYLNRYILVDNLHIPYA
jgi:hypothetical protein